ncbi:hypothetical protein [Trichothermofontia sp.]
MLIERRVTKNFRWEATVIFLMIAIATYVFTSNTLPILVTFVGFFIFLSLLSPRNIVYTLQLDRIGFCFRENQRVKYQYSWSEIETVMVEAEYGGGLYEITLLVANSFTVKTLPFYLTAQEANTLHIQAAKWPEATSKIEVRL